jgi:hypothetical protein
MASEQTGSKVGIVPKQQNMLSQIRREVHVGELLTENFAHLVTYCNGERWLSGWDVDINGNFVDSAFCQWFKIIKKKNGGLFSMNKRFAEQKDAVITFETRFNLSGQIPGFSVSLLSGDREAIRVFTDRHSICICDSFSDKIEVMRYTAETEYGLKIVADISANTFDLFINGTLKAKAVTFYAQTDRLNRVCVQVDDEADGEIFLRTVRVHKGYRVNERLISTVPGEIPSDWTSNTGTQQVCVREMWSDMAPDLYSFYLRNTQSDRHVVLSRNFDPIHGKFVVDFQVLFPSNKPGFRCEVCAFPGFMLALTADGTSIHCSTPKGENLLWGKYRPNVWYRIKARIDPGTNTATIWINGKQKADRMTLWQVDDTRSGISFLTGDEADFECWLDDVLIYPFKDLPKDYVPAPEPVKTDPYIVGVQCCSLWKEGSHNGWDPVSRDLRRKPLLGWYEEGNPETSDWQTKWMAEHGISFNLYCWYPPFGRNAVPIKRSLSDYDLVEGYYYGEYSHHLKYMIMWENGNTTCEGFDDYKENLVPFWIENHYKDPRYLMMDGKPVMGFYDPLKLITQVGGEENAVQALLYLRTECIKAGFDGIHIICEYRGTDPILMKKFRDMGFEFSYSYTWFSGDPKVQKEKILAQKDANGTRVIPTVCMGWMPSAWGGKDVSWSTPDEFRSLLSWVKEDFMTKTPEPDSGSRMVMIGNWNEYGEGHFIMPANLYGFGYLDAIRSVFSFADNNHTDSIPNETQRARLDTLYPRGWT